MAILSVDMGLLIVMMIGRVEGPNRMRLSLPKILAVARPVISDQDRFAVYA